MEYVFVKGDICRILPENESRYGSGHYFDEGEIVRIVEDELDDDGHLRAEYMDGHDYWYVFPCEIELVTGVA